MESEEEEDYQMYTFKF